jgi:hypothetical protein
MSTQHGETLPTAQSRKPRIALMGEFSAGKSTLMNLLLGCDPMPVRITATRVPPVWVTHGTRGATLVHHDGSEVEFSGGDISEAPIEDTAFVRFYMDSDILNLCDLIDIPGISDPNLNHESWMALLDEVDCVIWCTHATQAWRQSEAALWAQIGEAIKGPNHLVVTQFDKLRSERDRGRVLARLEAEAGEVFDSITPIATLDAINAGMDETAWQESGGAALIERMVGMLVQQSETPAPTQCKINSDALEPQGAAEDLSPLETSTSVAPDGPVSHDVPEKKVVPRRVRPKSPNPTRPSSEDLQSMSLQTVGGGPK